MTEAVITNIDSENTTDGQHSLVANEQRVERVRLTLNPNGSINNNPILNGIN